MSSLSCTQIRLTWFCQLLLAHFSSTICPPLMNLRESFPLNSCPAKYHLQPFPTQAASSSLALLCYLNFTTPFSHLWQLCIVYFPTVGKLHVALKTKHHILKHRRSFNSFSHSLFMWWGIFCCCLFYSSLNQAPSL